jgi:hypothetical protein
MRYLASLSILASASCASENASKVLNSVPTIEILSHSDGSQLEEGASVEFFALASDLNDDTDSLLVAWYLDDDMVCDWAAPDSEGMSNCAPTIPEELGIVAALVQDPQQGSARDEISVVVGTGGGGGPVASGEAPMAVILTPRDGDILYAGTAVSFSAVLFDEDSSLETLEASWVSSLDGSIDAASAPDAAGNISGSALLGEGTHGIVLTVSDPEGNSATASATVEVLGNVLPECAIGAPTDGEVWTEGQEIGFSGTGTDSETPSEELSHGWSSDLQGSFGSPSPDIDGLASFAYSGLSAGSHLITLEVQDASGGTCASSVSLLVEEPPPWTSAEFGSCTEGGAFGPGQSLCDTAYTGTSLEGAVSVEYGIQLWTVPYSGTYLITASGAEGGTSTGESGGTSYAGGLGSMMEGSFQLAAGEILSVLVGQRGTDSHCGSGGGGGTFVTSDLQGLLLAAGGGGGGFHCNALGGYIGGDAQTSEDGGAGICSPERPSLAGGTGGYGGSATSYGTGGSGILSAGTGSCTMFPNPSDGGSPGGGFGGGGCYYIGCCGNSGGGGGYSGGSLGGSDGCAGGGGGSYNTGSSPSSLSGANSGDGSVQIALQ